MKKLLLTAAVAGATGYAAYRLFQANQTAMEEKMLNKKLRRAWDREDFEELQEVVQELSTLEVKKLMNELAD
ncbi:hypothetical protein ACRHK7_07085 [Weissella tructae]|jgi:uncharacterized protein YaaW (UPF0174 family)|uniref:Uncharacterized protein n=2 Tax=Weissella TaxID=46255 RepID=A0A075TZV2_9LACO|nr:MULTISPECIES: hypothetical protein [Weissella]AIG65413.1 hypothetical protein WS08_0474 [Weissella tructae]AIM62726.1 hypothetical protein WS74_0474 [Weissella ceti]AIM64062.1 hypothetical protein WS105_0472 [Weissella ceti]ELA07127.1 hypothetical protein WCNC_06087 [Weissella ceti NC36]QVV91790.1 hypothetical protein KHQ32_02635 [Weissella tructae]